MNCKTCRFFDENKNPTHVDKQIGICRRYPPKLVPWEDFSMTQWPDVNKENDWCGEYVRICPD